MIGNGCLINLPRLIGFQHFIPDVYSCVCVCTRAVKPVLCLSVPQVSHSTFYTFGGIESFYRAEVCHLVAAPPSLSPHLRDKNIYSVSHLLDNIWKSYAGV